MAAQALYIIHRARAPALALFAALACGASLHAGEPSAAPAAAPVPEAVRKAVEAAAPAPDLVITGAYINDIHELDFRSHSFDADLYVWFRWHNKDANPVKSMEFMNRYSPTEH